MDDAALRVNPSSLQALVRLRGTRERQALLELQRSLADRDASRAARDNAQSVLAAAEVVRSARESALYDALPTAVAGSAYAVHAQHAAVERWTEVVDEAAGRRDEAQFHLEAADEAAQDARNRYAARARASRKSTRIEALVAGAKCRRDEAAVEREIDDDTNSHRSRETPGFGLVRKS
jgi:hypothetical protein